MSEIKEIIQFDSEEIMNRSSGVVLSSWMHEGIEGFDVDDEKLQIIVFHKESYNPSSGKGMFGGKLIKECPR